MNYANDEFIELLNWLENQGMLTKKTIELISMPITKNEEDKWADVRKSFFPNADWQFNAEPMNSANLCPTWHEALRLIHEYRYKFNQDISIQFRRNLFRTIFPTIKNLVAKHIGADPVNVALVRNTSEGNNQLSRGFKNWGDREVVLWDENHPTNNFTWESRSPSEGQVKKFSISGVDFTKNDEVVKTEIISRIISKITSKTAILTFSEVSNISGIRMPSADIIKAVRAHEILKFKRTKSIIHIHVDGAVSWGAININVKETDCDSFASSSHKWMMGPFETGIFYMKAEKTVNFDISIHGYDGNIDFIKEIPANASRFEYLGQRDEANLLGLGAAVTRNLDLGPQVIEERIHFLQDQLRMLLDRMAVKLNYTIRYATPKSRTFSSGVTIFQLVNQGGIAINHRNLNTYLYANGKGFAVADTGDTNQLRICTHIMNLEQNVSAIVTAIERFIRSNSASVFNEKEIISESMIWPDNPYLMHK